jgi:DNA polymerase-3 subunit gamma/tau
MSQAFYRKYRPQGWAEVVAQDHVVQTLKNAIAADRVGHAYLFAGPRGTGKTTLARLLAKAVNCLNSEKEKRPDNECQHCRAVNENRFLDLIEIDGASNNGVDEVRDLRDKINFMPTQGKFKIYIIDEVHMLSTAAFNALLKTLEEPPPHAIFILATTEIHKLPATVLSRCQRHEFRRVPLGEISRNLQHIVENEGLQADGEALDLIARQATGSIRDAQSLLDQLASNGTRITVALAQAVLGTAASQTVLEIIAAVLANEAASGLHAISLALDSGVDPRSLARQLVEYLRGVILTQLGNAAAVPATAAVKQQMQAHTTSFSRADLLRMIRAFNAAATEVRGSSQPSLGLELAFLELVDNGTTPSPARAQAAFTARTAPGSPVRPDHGVQVAATKPVVGTSAGPAAAPSDSRRPAVSSADVLREWKGISRSLGKSHAQLSALMNSVRMIDVQQQTLVVGLASAVLVKQLEKPEYIELTRKALAEALGVEFEIRGVVTNARGKLPPDVSEDGMVAAALNKGGEIVDVQD